MVVTTITNWRTINSKSKQWAEMPHCCIWLLELIKVFSKDWRRRSRRRVRSIGILIRRRGPSDTSCSSPMFYWHNLKSRTGVCRLLIRSKMGRRWRRGSTQTSMATGATTITVVMHRYPGLNSMSITPIFWLSCCSVSCNIFIGWKHNSVSSKATNCGIRGSRLYSQWSRLLIVSLLWL